MRRPVRTRSVRRPKPPGYWRDRLALLLAVATIVCLGAAFFLARDTRFLMPGPLASVHGAIENCSKKPEGGLIIFPDGLLINYRELIVETAARYRLPAAYPFRVFPEAGGLLSYGPNFKSIFRKTAEYVDKILKGAKPADLPVESPTELEFVINLKTASALGLSVSPRLQIAANELIQ